MRLLADENFPKPIVDALRADGHDVLWDRTDLAGWKDVVVRHKPRAAVSCLDYSRPLGPIISPGGQYALSARIATLRLRLGT